MKIAEVDAAMVLRLSADMPARGESVLRELKAEGAPIIEVIKAAKVAFGTSLAEAKELVSQHDAWAALAGESTDLQNDALAAFEAAAPPFGPPPTKHPAVA